MALPTRTEVANCPDLRCSDDDPHLAMYCYDECSRGTSELVKNSRGIVFEKATNRLVSQVMCYATELEFSPANYGEIQDLVKVPSEKSASDLKALEAEKKEEVKTSETKTRFFKSYEGALIRLFYYRNRWYVTSHRKLDAFVSFWGSLKTFGTMFKEAVENHFCYHPSSPDEDPRYFFQKYLDTLDQSLQYLFLISNNRDNYLVSTPQQQTAWHIGTYRNVYDSDGSLLRVEEVPEATAGLHRVEELSISTFGELQAYMQTVDYRTSQGVIAWVPSPTGFHLGSQIKLFDPEYYRYFQVRGNEASVKFRYLQLRQEGKWLTELRALYPHYVQAFAEYEEILSEITQQLLSHYENRYLHRNVVRLAQETELVIKRAHSIASSGKKIDLSVITTILNTSAPSFLNKLIQAYNKAKKDRMTENLNKWKIQDSAKTLDDKVPKSETAHIELTNKTGVN